MQRSIPQLNANHTFRTRAMWVCKDRAVISLLASHLVINWGWLCPPLAGDGMYLNSSHRLCPKGMLMETEQRLIHWCFLRQGLAV